MGVPDHYPGLMGSPTTRVTLGKVGSRLEGVGLALFVSADGVAIVLPGRSGLRGAARWGGNHRTGGDGSRARGTGQGSDGARRGSREYGRRAALRRGGVTRRVGTRLTTRTHRKAGLNIIPLRVAGSGRRRRGEGSRKVGRGGKGARSRFCRGIRVARGVPWVRTARART